MGEDSQGLIRELGLNQDVATKLREAMENTRKQLEPLWEQMRTLRMEIEKHLRTDMPDEAAALAAVDKMADLYKQIIAIRVSNRNLIAGLLTPEQLAKFNELRAKMEASREERMQKWREENHERMGQGKGREEGRGKSDEIRQKPQGGERDGEGRGKGQGPQSREHREHRSRSATKI
jgi:Spy/CpxP family protein refolding chaperone